MYVKICTAYLTTIECYRRAMYDWTAMIKKLKFRVVWYIWTLNIYFAFITYKFFSGIMLIEAGCLSAGVTWLVKFYIGCPIDRAKETVLGKKRKQKEISHPKQN